MCKGAEMNMKKGCKNWYWLSLVLLVLGSITPLTVIILSETNKNTANELFFTCGVLILATTANLASYLTSCFNKNAKLGSMWIRLFYVALNTLAIIFNVILVTLIYAMF